MHSEIHTKREYTMWAECRVFGRASGTCVLERVDAPLNVSKSIINLPNTHRNTFSLCGYRSVLFV
jgi:hypothetical protein